VRRHALALAALLLVVTSCGDDTDEPASSGTTVTSAAPDETTTTAAATTTVDDVELLVVLNPDGIGFTTAGSGSISRTDFGSAQTLVRDTVVKSLGEPVEEGEQPECPPGPAEQSRWDDITLTFQDGTFVGWSISRTSRLTTVDGIGLGTTRAELEDAFADFELVESTLGVEATAGSYTFLLSDDTDAGTVDSMLAGVNCVFR
jgi:hypothetical protein